MRIFTPLARIQRNVKIGRYALNIGMVILAGALILDVFILFRSLSQKEPTLSAEDTQLTGYLFAAFIVGFTLFNIGTIFNNRWGRRPDLRFADALKGLDGRYTLYNSVAGATHVLVGPGGALVLVPRFQPGPIQFNKDKNRWLAPSAPRGMFGVFNTDPLGNPASEAAVEVDRWNETLKKHLGEISVVPQVVVVFFQAAAVATEDAPVKALHAKQLKDYVRRLPKTATLSDSQRQQLEEALGLSTPQEDA
jgi:hypothetical protein